MTIAELGAWGEFLGGIAVVGGLVFVGVQLRVANREARVASNQAFANSINNLGSMLANSTEMSDIWYRGLSGLENLEVAERVRFTSMISNNILRTFENLHSHYRDGRLDDRLWAGSERLLQSVAQNNGFIEIWQLRKLWYNPSFQTYIDGLLEAESDLNLLDSYGVSENSKANT